MRKTICSLSWIPVLISCLVLLGSKGNDFHNNDYLNQDDQSINFAIDKMIEDLNDLAIYRPGVAGWMTPAEQEECADYILNNVVATTELIFAGYQQSVQDSLASWISDHLDDGESDVLIILDVSPAALYQGELDGSLAEAWMENGNMLIWTGAEPFYSYVNGDGTQSDISAGSEGASDVLDVSTPELCRGSGLQETTSAVEDYGISSFAEYEADRSLRYDQLLIDSLTSDWHNMSYWRVDEIFSEDSEFYRADNIILVNEDSGRFAQFYCKTGDITGPDGVQSVNYYRQRVITQFLNHWVSLPCNTWVVPDDYPTIQSAIDAAQPRDTVLVKAGTYHEPIAMKKGVKVVSDSSDGGNDLVPGPGYADTEYGVESKQVLRRALRTIIDGTGLPGGTEADPMVDFPKGSTVASLIDGFTVQNMPSVDHTLPGHSHVLQCRGASGTMINNIVHDNGSSGLGSHAWFYDQQSPMEERDFRYTNIQYDSHPIIVNNVVYRNEGNNLGNNHYAYAIFYNNECFESVSIDDHPAPGVGNQHGAHALIVGNLVYKSDWVGIGGKKGDDQGAYPINRPTHPTVRNNRVYDSGDNAPSGSQGAGIGADETGGFDPKLERIAYHVIEGNYVDGAQNAAIGCQSGDPDLGHVRIVGNEALHGGRIGMGAGIGIMGATASEVVGNISHDNSGPGIGIQSGGHAETIADNLIYRNLMAGIGIDDVVSSVGEIRENEILGNGQAGVGCNGPVEGIYNNIVSGNGMAGIACYVAPVRVVNNVVAFSGTVGIANWSGVPAAITNNICYFNTTVAIKSDQGGYSFNCVYGNNGTQCTEWMPWCYLPQYGGSSPGPGAMVSNPLFVDPINSDFHLRDVSPCINAGKDAGVYTDMDGDARPQCDGFDIGADESPACPPQCFILAVM